MTADSLRRSPLATHPLAASALRGTLETLNVSRVPLRASGPAGGGGVGVRLAEVPFRAAVNVQGTASFPTPPPGGVATWGDRSVLWLGPSEWLVIDGEPIELPGGVDVSANRTTIEVSGPNARDVLEKGCTLDLHPRAFTAGRCAQTTLARAQVILWQTTDEPAYHLLVRGSFAQYVADWLVDAAQEYL